MNKKTLLQLIGSFIALFVLVQGVLGQNPNYQPYADMTADQGDGPDSVTVNSDMVYYVEPDPGLNNLTVNYDTSWDQANAQSNGVNSTFNFVWDGAGAGTIKPPQAGWNAPFRRIKFESTGSAILNVTEVAAAGCPDPSPTQLNIEVISAPSFSVGNPAEEQICHSTGAAGYNISLSSITAPAERGWVNLRMDYTVDVDSDGDGSFDDQNIRTTTDTIVKLYDNAGSEPSAADILSSTLYMGTRNNGDITRYRFDFGGTVEGSANNGINDHISRKSDYFDEAINDLGSVSATDYSFYASTDGGASERIIDIVVYPQPETQNIYYVPNEFDK